MSKMTAQKNRASHPEPRWASSEQLHLRIRVSAYRGRLRKLGEALVDRHVAGQTAIGEL